MTLSVIIPLKRREPLLNKALENIPDECEIIITGHTELNDISKENNSKNLQLIQIDSDKRSLLMNYGAGIAKGEMLLFLHPDTYMKKSTFQKIINLSKAKPGKKFAGGGVHLKFFPDTFALRLMAFGSNLRMRIYNSIYGDQCIFVRKKVFDRLGGFRNIGICEDLEFSQRFRKAGRLKYFKYCYTSGRRFIKNGIFNQWIKNQKVKFLYHKGATDKRLRGIYGK